MDEITDAVFDAVIGPIALAACLQQFTAIVDEVGPVEEEFFEGLVHWPEDWRESTKTALLKEFQKLATWANGGIRVIKEFDVQPNA